MRSTIVGQWSRNRNSTKMILDQDGYTSKMHSQKLGALENESKLNPSLLLTIVQSTDNIVYFRSRRAVVGSGYDEYSGLRRHCTSE